MIISKKAYDSKIIDITKHDQCLNLHRAQQINSRWTLFSIVDNVTTGLQMNKRLYANGYLAANFGGFVRKRNILSDANVISYSREMHGMNI